MARKKIREYHGKRLLQRNIGRFSKLSFAAQVNPVLVTAETLQEWKKLKNTHPWLLDEKLVAKPDMLFGKRGKYGLVKVNANLKEVKQFITEKIKTPIKIGEVTGNLTHWLVEPFVPHKEEFYFSIESQREQTIVNFSTHGGIEVEENWEKIKSLSIPVGHNIKNISPVILPLFVPFFSLLQILIHFFFSEKLNQISRKKQVNFMKEFQKIY